MEIVRGPREPSRDQQRWDGYGAEKLAAFRSDPSRFVITTPPYADVPFVKGLVEAVGPVARKDVLELGCGYGQLSVYLAKQGARVTGIDIGTNLVAAARELAGINGVQVRFDRGDVSELPYPSGSADVVVGLAVLHHLSERDLSAALAETHRVLRPGGTAVFTESVEDSPAFDFVQNLVPAGKAGDADYRPSLLQRREWARYVAAEDQRSLTTRELRHGGGAPWSAVEIVPYGLASRLERVLPPTLRPALWSFDEKALKVPPLRRFCRTALVRYVK